MSEFLSARPRVPTARMWKARLARDRVFLNNPGSLCRGRLAPLIVAATTLKTV